jgi:predicted HTH domain antitoxin
VPAFYHPRTHPTNRKVLCQRSCDLAAALRLPEDERLSRLQRELSICLYQKGLLSFGKARELAALSKWEFHELLSQESIERSYDEEELEDDLATLEALG